MWGRHGRGEEGYFSGASDDATDRSLFFSSGEVEKGRKRGIIL